MPVTCEEVPNTTTLNPFTFDGKNYLVGVTQHRDCYDERKSWSPKSRKTRVFISGVPDPKMEVPDQEDNAAWKKYNKTELVNQKAFIDAASGLNRILDLPEFKGPVSKALNFSRKCGCKCPCSPGYYGPGQLGTFWIEVREVKPTTFSDAMPGHIKAYQQ